MIFGKALLAALSAINKARKSGARHSVKGFGRKYVERYNVRPNNGHGRPVPRHPVTGAFIYPQTREKLRRRGELSHA